MVFIILGRIEETKSQFWITCYPTPSPVSYAAYKLLALTRCSNPTYRPKTIRLLSLPGITPSSASAILLQVHHHHPPPTFKAPPGNLGREEERNKRSMLGRKDRACKEKAEFHLMNEKLKQKIRDYLGKPSLRKTRSNLLPINMSLQTCVEVELGCDNCFVFII